jgi:DHA2 family multidrug resistance protein
MLARRSQFHQNILVSHVTDTNPVYQQYFEGAKAMLIHQGTNAIDAAAKANALIYGFVQQQATMLAYIDSFWLFAMIFLLTIPLVFLLKKTVPHKEPVSAH